MEIVVVWNSRGDLPSDRGFYSGLSLTLEVLCQASLFANILRALGQARRSLSGLFGSISLLQTRQ
ncbi:hypothetical protein FIV00_00685 [Labrenzia sp. THAF82]|nr:hypothetical protein FIV00_00685 [Labrenzia sp. THAF82]